MRTRLTVALDEELLRAARSLAARDGTTVNELVREFLQQVVTRERWSAWEGIRDMVENPRVRVGDRLPARDELHRR